MLAIVMLRIALAVVCSVFLVSPEQSRANDPLPACIHTASDYDGDGWGWELNSVVTNQVPTFQSCVVDATSIGPPTHFTNLETNEAVNLVRPYWNAYRDFEGRTIQCDFYASNQNNKYEERYFGPFNYSNGFQYWAGSWITTEHFALQANNPWSGYARNFAYDGNQVSRVSYAEPFSYWTVNDGIYYSNAGNKQDGREHVLSGSRYIELIDDHNGAIRYWNYQDRNGANGYAECYDVSGRSFQPSGYMGEPRPAAQTVDDPLIAAASSPGTSAGIINLETGQSVDLYEVKWNLTKLYNETIQCQSVHWTDDSQWAPYTVNNGVGYSTAVSALTAYYQPYTRHVLYSPDYKTLSTSHTARGLFSSYEVFSGNTVDGNWLLDNGKITEGPLARYRYMEVVDAGNSNNTENRFWISSEAYDVCSQIPEGALEIVTSPSPACIDTDGDGWGWDGVRSCRITTNPAACIDTDGDGWGWDGIRTCRVETTPAACIDSDGDGWGWDGIQSCRVASTTPQCVDSDGDGWGWNGTSTCSP